MMLHILFVITSIILELISVATKLIYYLSTWVSKTVVGSHVKHKSLDQLNDKKAKQHVKQHQN